MMDTTCLSNICLAEKKAQQNANKNTPTSVPDNAVKPNADRVSDNEKQATDASYSTTSLPTDDTAVGNQLQNTQSFQAPAPEARTDELEQPPIATQQLLDDKKTPNPSVTEEMQKSDVVQDNQDSMYMTDCPKLLKESDFAVSYEDQLKLLVEFDRTLGISIDSLTKLINEMDDPKKQTGGGEKDNNERVLNQIQNLKDLSDNFTKVAVPKAPKTKDAKNTIQKITERFETGRKLVSMMKDKLVTETQKKDAKKHGIVGGMFFMIIMMFVRIVQDYKKCWGISKMVCIYSLLGLASVITTGVLATYYLVTAKVDKYKSELLKNPINRESFAYNVARSGSLFGSRYKYPLLWMIPMVGLIFCLLGLKATTAKGEGQDKGAIPGSIMAVLFACSAQSFVALLANFIIIYLTNRVLRVTTARIGAYNQYVLSRIIVNANFLAQLQTVPQNSFAMTNTVRAALLSLNKDASIEEIAKAIFTLNLFIHYQKMGQRNIHLGDALNQTFRLSSLLTARSYSPSDFLFRRVTFIKDNSNLIHTTMMMLTDAEGKKHFTPQAIANVNKALISVTDWTNQANFLANSFYPDDAVLRFDIMSPTVCAVSTLPVVIAIYVARNKTLMYEFRRLLHDVGEHTERLARLENNDAKAS